MLRKNEASQAQPQGKLGLVWEGSYRVVEANQNGVMPWKQWKEEKYQERRMQGI